MGFRIGLTDAGSSSVGMSSLIPLDLQDFCVEDYFAVLAELIRKERARPHYFNTDSETGVHYEPFNKHHPDSRFFDYQVCTVLERA